MNTISTKQIRSDLVGFLRRLQQGEKITVIHRSTPIVTLSSTDVRSEQEFAPGSPAAVLRAIRFAQEFEKEHPSTLDPHISYKEQYAEHLEEKYGLA